MGMSGVSVFPQREEIFVGGEHPDASSGSANSTRRTPHRFSVFARELGWKSQETR